MSAFLRDPCQCSQLVERCDCRWISIRMRHVRVKKFRPGLGNGDFSIIQDCRCQFEEARGVICGPMVTGQ